MELGCDGVLVNTAIARANNPEEMAKAMKFAVIAGKSYIWENEKKFFWFTSSPKTGII